MPSPNSTRPKRRPLVNIQVGRWVIRRDPQPAPLKVHRLLGTAEERAANPDRWL